MFFSFFKIKLKWQKEMTEDSMGSGRPRKNTRKSNGNIKYKKIKYKYFFYPQKDA